MPAPHISTEQLLQHQDWLFRLVRTLVKDDFTADDMVQATLAEALADENAGRTNLRAWLGSTARRLTAQNWRSEYRRQQREDKVGLSDEAILQQSSEVTEVFHITNQALGDLPENERVVIMLRHMQGWKSERVAAELDIPIEQVYRDAERGCKKLRDRLQTRYGKEWKASCIAILGIPLGRSTAAPFGILAAGIAASLALVAGGLWLGGVFDQKSTTTDLDALALHEPSSATKEAASASNAPLGIDRVDLPNPANLAAGYPIQIVDPEGKPVFGAEITANFDDGNLSSNSADRFFHTDSSGMANVTLPLEFDLDSVLVQATGLFFQQLFGVTYERGVPFQIQLTRGSIPARFQTSLAQEGLTLMLRSDQGYVGYCVTDSAGYAELLLPHPGKYQVGVVPHVEKSTTVKFHALEGGMKQPVNVPYVNLKAFSLLAIDAESEGNIPDAKFYLTWKKYDENHRVIGQNELLLDSTNGSLDYSHSLDAAKLYSIRITADGYLDSFVSYVGDASETWRVPMDREEWVRASLSLGPNRKIVSAEKLQGARDFEFPVDPNDWSREKWRNQPARTLQVLAPQTVLFPRTKVDVSSNFTLHAVDDLGHHWFSKELSGADAQGSEPSFRMEQMQMGVTTFNFHDAPQHDHSGSYDLDFTIPIPGKERHRIFPDENGVVKTESSKGNGWTLNYKGNTFSYSVFADLPAETENPTFHITVPPRNSTLHGTVLDSMGKPFPNTSAKVIAASKVSVQGPGTFQVNDSKLTLDVVNGVIHAENVFAGTYDITISHGGQTIQESVTAGVDFELQAPPSVQFQLQVRDSLSLEPLASQLMRPHPLYSPRKIADSDSITGHLTAYLLADEDTNQLFIQAEGHQPKLLSDFLHGSTQIVDLEKGRSLRLGFEELRIQATPGAHWTLDAWGGEDDPRQQSIYHGPEFFTVNGAPMEDFVLTERKDDGTPTGRTITVSQDGLIQVNDA